MTTRPRFASSLAPLASMAFLPALVVAFVAPLGVTACKRETGANRELQGSPPPPAATVASGAASGSPPTRPKCDQAAVGFSNPKVGNVLPPSVAGFCVLKSDPVRSWGEGEPADRRIENVADIIDGSGELYSKNYYAKRYDSLKYVDDRGTEAAIDVALSTFDRPENAYGLFTYKLVANADPDPEAMKKAQRRPWRSLPAGGAAALGNAAALLWKGNYLVELTYSPDPTKSLAEATAAADAVLPRLAEAIGEKIVGSIDVPADVKALPTEAEGRIPLGIDYVPPKFSRPEGKGDALHVTVAGGYATAYVHDGDKRYRVLAFAREDRDAARDAFAAFARLPGAVPIKEPIKDKDFVEDAVHFSFPVGNGGAGAAGKAEGVAVRKGSLMLAMIDEELALGDPSSMGAKGAGAKGAKEEAWPRTTRDEKLARLKKLIEARTRPATGPK